MSTTSRPPDPADRSGPASSHTLALMQMIHRVRTGGSMLCLLILGSHLQAHGASATAWLLAALQFLVYPHLIHRYAQRAANPFLAGLHNFLLDAVLLGLWAAALGYPLWITFTLLVCNLVSVMLYLGPRGTLLAAAAFILPGLGWLFATGTALDPHTSTLTTALSAVGVTGFLLLVAHMNFRRTAKLRDTREALRRSEQALQQQLAEINVLQARLSEQANRDPLTGLYNRRYLDSTLDRELARCQREGQPLSLMLIDLDHFKQTNDTYGHQAGDQVLVGIAICISDSIKRAGDCAARYGGEEFAVLLPSQSSIDAMTVAETIRRKVQSWSDQPTISTVSVGIASVTPTPEMDWAAFVNAADRALYAAKAAGRNCCVLAPMPMETLAA